MKRVLVFSFLMAVCFFAGSQTYYALVGTGKTWSTYHDYCKGGYYVFSTYVKFEGDTIIDTYSYKKVWETANADSSTWHTMDGFIREDQKKVYFRFTPASPEMLIYDFGAEIGDTMYLELDSYPYVMDSVGQTTLLDGTYRKQYYVHSTEAGCTETWTEGIGSDRGVLGGGTCFFVGDDPQLICFTEHDTLKYHNPLFSECYVITGIKENLKEAGINIFPNPARESLKVIFNKPSAGERIFEIFGISGNKLLSVTINNQQSTIALSSAIFIPGSYIYRVLEKGQVTATGNLVVQGE